MISTHRAGAALCSVLFALVLAACGSTQPVSQPLRLNLYGTPGMNSTADDAARGNAAVVRIYQLADAASFRDVTLDTFWRDDAAALGEDVIGSQQVLLYPDQAQTVEVEPAEGVRYIGVAVDLRQPEPNGWRQVYTVEELRGRDVRVEVEAARLRVSVR